MAKEKTKKSQTRVKRNQKLYKDTIITESYAIHHSIIVLLILSLLANSYTLYHFITVNHNKVKIVTKTKTEIQEKVPENIVFLGDSITEYYDLEKYYPNNKVVNSGVGGNQTKDILADLEERIYRYNPSKIFLLIGTNDLNAEKEINEIVKNTEEIITKIRENRKTAELYVESIYPINHNIKGTKAENRENEDIEEINKKIEEYCKEKNVTFIDVYKELKDEDNNLKKDYTKDGLHLNDSGYEVITKKLTEYIKE